MKSLFLNCEMGVAGDMLTAALLDTFPISEREQVLEELNAMGIPTVTFAAETAVKCGITGLHMHVDINGVEEGDEHEHHHHHDHEHHHHHDHDHDHDHDHGHEHGHDHEHHHHDHDHEHADEHAHEHSHGHHEHRSMADIVALVQGLSIPEQVREDVLAVYQDVAAAESKVHGVPVTEIHFHEVGMMDAVADIAAVSYLIRKIGAERIVVSPVCVGSGTVKCAHGILPVPAPATAHLLKGVPYYSDDRRGELTTPTGAALVKHFATEFGPMPVMDVRANGYGMGKKDFPWANCVRVELGETAEKAVTSAASSVDTGAGIKDAPAAKTAAEADADHTADAVWELAANLDDMTGEEVGYAMDALLEAGALDVWTQAIGMKKSRPGILLTVLVDDAKHEAILAEMFRVTTTLGVREVRKERRHLTRRFEEVATPLGSVRKKISEGFGVTREKYEYEDLAKIASEQGMSIAEVRKIVVQSEMEF